MIQLLCDHCPNLVNTSLTDMKFSIFQSHMILWWQHCQCQSNYSEVIQLLNGYLLSKFVENTPWWHEAILCFKPNWLYGNHIISACQISLTWFNSLLAIYYQNMMSTAFTNKEVPSKLRDLAMITPWVTFRLISVIPVDNTQCRNLVIYSSLTLSLLFFQSPVILCIQQPKQ